MAKRNYFLFGEAPYQLRQISERYGSEIENRVLDDLEAAAEDPAKNGGILSPEILKARRDGLSEANFKLLKQSRFLDGTAASVMWIVVPAPSGITAPTGVLAAFHDIELTRGLIVTKKQRKKDETIRAYFMRYLRIEDDTSDD